MVFGAFPVFKLGILALYQISKPVSQYYKRKLAEHPIFLKYICLPTAQAYHRCEVRIKLFAMNLGRPVTITPLNEKDAIDLAANLIGEGIVFVICGAGLTYEFIRQKRKEKKKRKALALENENYKTKVVELNELMMQQDDHIEQMTEIINSLRGKK